MFVYTVTKKRAVRLGLLILAVVAGIIIGIAAILTAISSGADERKIPIYHVDRSDNKVALTFNCAWGNSNTDQLLEVLEKENIKSTFFVTGEFCDKYPEDVLKIFKAGHEIQSHSDKHPHVEGANVNDFILDTREAERKISAITGVRPTLYRAPYGEYDNNSVFAINGMGYKYIQWSVDSIDWQEPEAKTIVKRTVGGTKSGSILLFHNDLENTTEALPEVITKLKEKGFDFVTVSDLIYWDSYTIDSSGKQIFDSSKAGAESVHTAGTAVNAAFELLLEHLTIEEIMSLQNGMSAEVQKKLSAVLNKEQINAIAALSDDELQSAFGMLVEAKMTGQTGSSLGELERIDSDDYGKFSSESDIAGGTATTGAATTDESTATTEPPESDEPTDTTAPENGETTPPATDDEELPLIDEKA